MASVGEIFTIFGSVRIDTDKAKDSINTLNKKAETMSEKFAEGCKTAAKWGAGIAAAATAAGAAIYKTVNDSAEKLDAVQKGAQKLSMSYGTYQELSYALDRSGASIDNLAKGMNNINADLAKTGDAADKAAKKYEKLGVSLKDTNGNMKSSEQVMMDSIMALADMEDTTQRNAVANEIFGKSYTELIPFLESGSEGIADLMQNAVDLGLVMEDGAIDAGAAFGDMLADVKDSLGAVTEKIGIELMPVVSELLSWVLEHMPEIQSTMHAAFDFMSSIVKVFIDIIQAVAPVVADIFENKVMPIVKKVTDWLQAHVEDIEKFINGLWVFLSGLFNVLYTTIQMLWNNMLKPIFEQAMDFFNEHADEIKSIIEGIAATVKWIYDSIVKPVIENMIMPLLMWLMDKISWIWNGVLRPILDGVLDFLGGIFSGNIESIFSGLISIILGIWEGIKTILLSPLEFFLEFMRTIPNTVSGIFRNIVNSVGSIWDSLRSRIKMPHLKIDGQLSIMPPSVPSVKVEWYAKAMQAGMILDGPTIFGRNEKGEYMGGGEAGPEAIVGVNTLDSMIASSVSMQTKGLEDKLSAVIDLLASYLPVITDNSSKPITLDGQAISDNTRERISREQSAQLLFKGVMV